MRLRNAFDTRRVLPRAEGATIEAAMPVPPIPPPLEQFGQRPFSFYPPLLNVDHNEWRFQRSTWSEILVRNTASGDEVWIPRRYLGEISRVDEPVMILGLLKELELRAGAVWPANKRVIEMPRAVNDVQPVAGGTELPPPAPAVGLRFESNSESRISKLIGGVLLIGIIACVVVVSLFRGGPAGTRVNYTTVLQSEIGLTAHDDYHAVIRKLGTPSDDHWRSDKGELQYRILNYPQQGLSVILMGSERGNATYIGAMDKAWKVVHSVELPDGRNTRPMLMALKRF
ncbi:MAG: hypothetical protein OZ929_06870 [Bryobacterales bacterium]|nr:hypothetical protein [Bryobacterales bacterium]